MDRVGFEPTTSALFLKITSSLTEEGNAAAMEEALYFLFQALLH
jgi:hypothetical protein